MIATKHVKGQAVPISNPPAEPSLLSRELGKILKVDVGYKSNPILSKQEEEDIKNFKDAGNYIAAAMIFLRDNALLERDLKHEDIKNRLLGHWGTCPGLVLVYAHLNRLIVKHDADILFVVGPGHGAPGILSSLWLEDSLSAFPISSSTSTSTTLNTQNKSGLQSLIYGFSTPGGYPSHINAETPGCIHEGGELGYALAVSYGAALDRKDLIVACVVGDGEAESGPTAAAWHAHKYIDPACCGAVLPILHINGFKISERTIFGCMDDIELLSLFSGYGHQPVIVSDLEDIDQQFAASLDWALKEIKKIQDAARGGKRIMKPRWPMIILRTPKGWSGPKKLEGEYIEGSFRSHQVPLPLAKSASDQLTQLSNWLSSYNISKHISLTTGEISESIKRLIPKEAGKRMGRRKEAYGSYEKLDVPDWLEAEEIKEGGKKVRIAVKKGGMESCMLVTGRFLKEVMRRNGGCDGNEGKGGKFRIFSPDELVSNKLDGVFDVTRRSFEVDPTCFGQGPSGGKVIEILPEHTCQGMLQGYTLTGRTGVFPSYESFLGIIHTMVVQYGKFVKMAKETPWRQPVGSLNYIETSTWTRQEHNGFSHQNPSFIGAILNLKPTQARVYLPPDANCFLSTMAHCLRSKDYVNLLVGSKAPTPVWLSPEEADKHCIAGASIWKFASTDDGVDPDVVLVGIGVELTFEVIAAASLLKKHCPQLRIRVINVTDLMILSPERVHPHSMTDDDFESLFTDDKKVIVNYHGYASEVRGLLGGRRGIERWDVEGYNEEGTTTTPFNMMLLNRVSRFHVAHRALSAGAGVNPKVAVVAHELKTLLMHLAEKEKQYAFENDIDRKEIYDVPKFD